MRNVLRLRFFLLMAFVALTGTIAIAQPTFTGGTPQTLTVCQNSGATSINALLQVNDPVSGSTETWTTFSAPAHGTLVAGYTTTSNGGVLLPTGLTYAPTAGFTGSDAFTVHVSNGTVTASTVINVTVTANPAAIGGVLSVCSGSTITLTESTTGGVWSNASSSVATVSSTGIVSGIAAGTSVISYTKNGCRSVATVTDKDAPVAITGATTVCVGSTITLADGSANGTWSSSSAAKASVVASTGVVTGVAQGTVTMTYSTGCGTAATYPIVVKAAPAAITGTLSECIGASVTLGNTAANGTWTTGNSSIATNSGNVITGVSANTVTVTYSTGCGSDANTVLTVKGSPAAISGPGTVCVGSTITLSDATTGTWTSGTPSKATIAGSTGVVTGVAQGTVTMTYSTGCGTAATYPVVVKTTPAAITGTLIECIGSSVTLADASTGGSWSTSDGTIATNSGNVITGVSANTVIVTYSTGCGTDATAVFTVKGSPAAITGLTSVCVGSTITLSDVMTSGTWSSSATAKATVVASTGVVTGVGAGAVNIIYSTGCGSSVTYAITVIGAPAAITGATSVCSGAGVILADATAGGTWSTSNTAIATNAAGNITGISAGTVTVTYNTGCGTPATSLFTVKGSPEAVSGLGSVCVGSTITLSDVSPGGTWTSSSTAKATVVSTTGVVTGVGAGTVNIIYNNGCGTATQGIAVIATPAAIAGTTSFCAGSAVTLTDAAAGGTWTTSNGAIATNSGGVITGVSAGTVTVTYSTGCGTDASTTVTVKGTPAAITGASSVCVGGTITLADVTPGGTWSSSSTAKATVVNSTGVVTGVAAGAVNIIYSNACGTSATYPINVISSAPAAIAGTLSACTGSTVILTDATASGSWSTTDPDIATNSGGNITGVSAGTVTVTYSTGCGTNATAVFTVKGTPAAITGPGSLCAGSTIALSDAVTGGIWSSSSTARATVVASTGVVTGIAAGAVNISYTTGCGTAAVYGINVLSAPAAITGTTTTFVGSNVTLADATAGGTWSSSNISIATVTTAGVITGVATGTVTITYSTGCGSDASVTVTISAGLTPITGGSSVCVGSTLALANATTGGVWSSSSTAKATVSNTGIVTGVAGGAVNILYTKSGSTATHAITVVAAPATITGTNSVCMGSTTTLANTAAGGTWTTGDPSIATNSGGVITGVAVGTVAVSYSTGCGSAATTTVTVKTTPASITGASTVCVGATITLADATTGGSWTSGTTGRATVVSSTGVVTGVSAGAVSIAYNNGCGTVNDIITVIAPPAAITGTTVACVGANVTLADATAGGTWTTSDAGVATNSGATITGTGAGAVTVTYSTGCGSDATFALTERTAPGPISGSNMVCVGGTITLTDGATGGTWTSSSAGNAPVGSNTGVVTGVAAAAVSITYNTGCGTVTYPVNVIAAPAPITGTSTICVGNSTVLADATTGGTWTVSDPTIATNSGGNITGVAAGTVTVTYSTGCGISPSAVVTVKAMPTAIAGPTTVCTGSTITLTDAIAGGSWTSGTPASASVVSSTGVVTGVAYGAVNITYSNGCGTAPTYAITVISSTPAAITGTTNVCVGSGTILADATPGGTWSTGDNSIATNSGANIVGVAAGTVTVTYNTGCGSSATTVTVKGAPVAITGLASVCAGSEITLADATVGGTWSSNAPTKASINASGIVTGVAPGAAIISYTSGCGVAATYTVTVKALPASITGTTTVCDGTTTSLADATISGTWSSDAPAIASVDAAGIVSGITEGTANISYTVNGCTVGTPVTVSGVPAAIAGASQICNGSSATYTDATSGGTWTSDNLTVATVSATGVVTGLSTGTITLSYTTGCAPAVTTVTIEGLPAAIAGTSSICTGNTATFTNSVSGGSWSSSSPAIISIDPLTGVANALSAGSANISYTLTNSCGTNAVAFSTVVAATGTWLGTTSTNFTDAGNWPCSIVPDVTTNVTIPSGTTYAPIISEAQAIKNLTVASGATLTINGTNTVSVTGSYTNNGSIAGTGVTAINGTSAQVLSGTGVVNNLQINNNASVNSGDTVKVTTDLYLTSGTLTTNNGVELVSDASGTARIAPITGGAISGNVTVQQYITGGRRAYRFWAHPFSASIPLSQIEQYVDITGVGGVTNGFTATASNSPSAYWYNSINGNSSLGSDPGWTAFTSTNGVGGNAVKPFEGFRLYIRGLKGEGLDGSAYTPSAVTINMAGPVNTGSIAMTMLKGTSGYGDYNLLGNPYPSPVDIGTVIYNAYTAGHIAGAAFYVWNPYLGTSGQFVTQPITSSPYSIQTNNSFEVRTASNGNVLNFTESNKTDAASAVLLRTANNEYLTLNIYDTTYHLWDMMYIKFNEVATEAEDVLYDGVKPAGPASLNFYSLSSDSKQLSLDARPYAAGKVIPLGIKSSYAQQFIIKADEAAIPAGGQVYLYDNYLNQSTMLTEGAEYRFSITTDSMSQGNKRFELRMGNTENVAVQVANTTTVQMVPNPATDEVSIVYSMQTKGNVSLRLLNVAGITMQSQDLGNKQSGNAQLNVASLAAGIYMVELTCGNEKVVKRLVKE